jgi:hypothetical protein
MGTGGGVPWGLASTVRQPREKQNHRFARQLTLVNFACGPHVTVAMMTARSLYAKKVAIRKEMLA